MKIIFFTKMVAAGNDFVVIDAPANYGKSQLQSLARRMCDRKYGIGADGLLAMGSSGKADIRMRIFNADGSEAEMCGNGARCAAIYVFRNRGAGGKNGSITLETKAGLIGSEVGRNCARIKLTDPKNIKLDIPLEINNRVIRASFINTGVPHAVIFVEGLERIDVAALGRDIRYHKKFAPAGTNADFVEPQTNNLIKVRTYERGVEDETLACGTGSVASALITAIKNPGVKGPGKMSVLTRGKEILTVFFEKTAGGFKNVWLEGQVKTVYKGAYYV